MSQTNTYTQEFIFLTTIEFLSYVISSKVHLFVTIINRAHIPYNKS